MASRREEDDRPAFQVSARTILQLGGELISSDGIAFYELIKNAVDAGSKKVFVEVVMRPPLETVHEATGLLNRPASSKSGRGKAIEQAKNSLIKSLAPDS